MGGPSFRRAVPCPRTTTTPNPNKFTSSYLANDFPFTSLSHEPIIKESFIDQINPVIPKQLTNHFSQSSSTGSPIISPKASVGSKKKNFPKLPFFLDLKQLIFCDNLNSVNETVSSIHENDFCSQ